MGSYTVVQLTYLVVGPSPWWGGGPTGREVVGSTSAVSSSFN